MRDVIAMHGRIFTHRDFMMLVWAKVTSDDGRRQLCYMLERPTAVDGITLCKPAKRRWGPDRARIRKVINPVDGNDLDSARHRRVLHVARTEAAASTAAAYAAAPTHQQQTHVVPATTAASEIPEGVPPSESAHESEGSPF